MKFQFNIYQRRFKQPLHTSHGLWQIREGIIITLIDSAGNTGVGEIAPLSWFGSETMSQALKFCRGWGDNISSQDIANIPDRLPCCQFAFESALLDLTQSRSMVQKDNLDYCYLLPAGKKALTNWQGIYQTKKNHTFKWKIGVYPLEQEIEILQQLIEELPSEVKLRLDANGGLNFSQAEQLLTVTENLKKIDFVEQPLPPNNLAKMLQLSKDRTTLLALDESVASFKQLQLAYQQGWQGVFIIKAAIMGFSSQLIKYCQANSLDVVISSVFETEVGRSAVFKIAQQLNHPRAIGFGVDYFVRSANQARKFD